MIAQTEKGLRIYLGAPQSLADSESSWLPKYHRFLRVSSTVCGRLADIPMASEVRGTIAIVDDGGLRVPIDPLSR